MQKNFISFINFYWELFAIVAVSILSTITLIVVNVYFISNIPVKCYVDNKLVYNGRSVGIDITSGGITTQVKIYGGFLYLFPKEQYVSNNVILSGKK